MHETWNDSWEKEFHVRIFEDVRSLAKRVIDLKGLESPIIVVERNGGEPLDPHSAYKVRNDIVEEFKLRNGEAARLWEQTADGKILEHSFKVRPYVDPMALDLPARDYEDHVKHFTHPNRIEVLDSVSEVSPESATNQTGHVIQSQEQQIQHALIDAALPGRDL